MTSLFVVVSVFAMAFTSAAQAAELSQHEKEERNKAAAIAYYNTQNTHDWQAARSYLSDDYVEHHPKTPKGIPGLKAVEGMYRSMIGPQFQAIILRVFAEGDLVAMHIRDIDEPGMKGTVLIAFFRFDDKGKIAEHWHALQPVVGPMNVNGMF
jgi:predicted SnoaL-like aldol condensation-catalyzing enzyme